MVSCAIGHFGKKGYMRTLEALIAVVLTLMFMMYIIPKVGTEDKQNLGEEILSSLESKDSFRHCALSGNETCIEGMVSGYLAKRYSYDVRVTDDPDAKVTLDVTGDIHADSIFIAGNDSYYNMTIVRLFYWTP